MSTSRWDDWNEREYQARMEAAGYAWDPKARMWRLVDKDKIKALEDKVKELRELAQARTALDFDLWEYEQGLWWERGCKA